MNVYNSLVDVQTVRRFLAIIHQQAESALDGASDPGFLQLGRVHPSGGAYVTTQFRIGDIDAMSEQACADAASGHNVYLEARTVRALKGGRGTQADTRGVFALVVDDDRDKGKGCADLPGASLIVETSPGNRHIWLFLDRALSADHAVPLGAALRTGTGTDADTGVITQPFRVSGTPNYPDANKVARGRVMTPTRILEASGQLWTPAGLRSAFPAAANAEDATERPTQHTKRETTGRGSFARFFIEGRLSEPVTPGPATDTSAIFQSIIDEAAAYSSLTIEMVEGWARAHPEGVAGKYLKPRDRLRAEVERSWRKAKDWWAEAYREGAIVHAERMQAETDAEDWNAPPSGKDADKGALIRSSKAFVGGFTPPDYLVDGLLQRRFCYALTGMTGSGKTALSLLLAANVARGMPFGGRDVESGRVLFMAGENPDDIRMRWLLLAQAEGFDVDEIDVDFIPSVFSLSALADRVQAEVKALGGVSLVIIDTSAAYFEGNDENSNKEAGDHARLFRSFTTLEGGPMVVVNAHPVKNPNADNILPRGGGAFIAEIDGNLTCVRSDMALTLHWQGKFRGPDFAAMTFELVSDTAPRLRDSRGKSIYSVYARGLSRDEEKAKASASRSAEDALMILLLDAGPMSLDAIAGSMNLHRSKVQRLVDAIKKTGKYIEGTRTGTALTERGKKEARLLKYNRDATGATYG